MSPEINDLYEKYARGVMDRREFLGKLAALAGGTAAAAALLPALERGAAEAQIVPKDDPRLETGYIEYPGATGKVRAYSARPKGGEKLSGVIVIHENRGLNPHTEDIARRVALEGFLAIAPDALSPLGGTPENPDDARPLFQKLDREANIKNFVAAVEYLKTQPQATGKVGCMGFCWGGGTTNQVAVNSPDLAAAVPFYGSQPGPEDVPKIKAAMLIHYAGDDERINAGIPAFEEALKKAGVEYKIHMYEGAGHAFMNDTGTRYHKEAAELAWQRTAAFLKEKLKA
ncbi:MAG: dienelactone hydrolase family protein [Acidobacteria bacterium]|nr:dienelactone hydrolase family protein [Acidobacteriota bacterium]MBE3126600.1 dienelactone hydrolase family protein [Acidobacteriota bacterium]MBE3131790.1 dienelactone hydrolase family protein [Acidobacteriota bacterium]